MFTVAKLGNVLTTHIFSSHKKTEVLNNNNIIIKNLIKLKCCVKIKEIKLK